MNGTLPAKLAQLLVGRAVPFGPNGELSGIDKRRVSRPLRLAVTGFEGDEQGDLSHHGGPDKALHHYPGEHYTVWRRDLPSLAEERLRVGAFGENISTIGLVEADVCLGDVFRLGTALVQVSQARQPCWKLNLRFGNARMSALVQASGRTGWYYRVLEPGEVEPGAELRIVSRPNADWPLARLLRYLYSDPLNFLGLEAMASLTALPISWRELARRRLASGRVEDWARRLGTPEARPSTEKRL